MMDSSSQVQGLAEPISHTDRATSFIRTVLQKYVVVFVGYTADDPPVQYLLEALNLDLGSLAGAYAFPGGLRR